MRNGFCILKYSISTMYSVATPSDNIDYIVLQTVASNPSLDAKFYVSQYLNDEVKYSMCELLLDRLSQRYKREKDRKNLRRSAQTTVITG